jgi:hypothetical protein
MRDGPRRLKIGDVSDQRVEGRAALGGIDGRDGGGVGSIRRQAVDGLGRQDDQPTVRQRARCVGCVQSWASM